MSFHRFSHSDYGPIWGKGWRFVVGLFVSPLPENEENDRVGIIQALSRLIAHFVPVSAPDAPSGRPSVSFAPRAEAGDSPQAISRPEMKLFPNFYRHSIGLEVQQNMQLLHD